MEAIVRQFYMLIILAMFCLILSACQHLRPEPIVLSSIPLPSAGVPPTSVPDTNTLSCAPHSDAAWRMWRATSRSATAQALLSDQDGVWIGASFGVWRFDARTGHYTSYQVTGTPYFFLSLGNGHVLTQAERGMYYYDGRQWTRIPVLGAQGRGTALAIDSSGNLWAEYQAGRSFITFRFSGHIPPQGRAWESADITGDPIFTSSTDCLRWQAFTMAGYAFRTTNECQTMLQARQIVPTLTRRDFILAADANGGVWWATTQAAPARSLNMYLGHLLSQDRSTVMDLPVHRVYALTAATGKGVWLGTEQGTAFSNEENLQFMPAEPGECILAGFPNDLVVDSQGTAWIATDHEVKTLKLNNSKWQPVMDLGLTSQEISKSIKAIAIAPGGGVWATHGNDLWRFGGPIYTPPALVPDQSAFGEDGKCLILHLQADGAGNIWAVAGACGIWQFIPANGGKWIHHTPGGHFFSLAVSTGDDVYALGSSGVFLLRNPALQNQADQSALNWELISEPVGPGAMAADTHNGVWLGRQGTGELWYYHDGKWTSFGKVAEQRLEQLYVDNQDQVWIATLGKELIIYRSQTRHTIPSPTEGKLIRGSDGHIWVMGYETIAVYDPTADQQP